MFGIEKLKEELNKLGREVSNLHDMCLEIKNRQDRIEESQRLNTETVNNQIEVLKIGVQKDLVEFHKELTDRYFDTLERILRVHSESSLVTALAHQVNEKDLNNLKSSLLQPFLEAKWAKDRQEKGQGIINKGEEIIKEWERLHEEIITKERGGFDFSKEKIQWDVLDKIVSELT